MPSRYYRRLFIKNYFYHVYNRGANKEKVFLNPEDYDIFMDILAYYLIFPSGKPLSVLERIKRKGKPGKVPNLVEIIKSSVKLSTYCLMPNHFHLLVKQSDVPTMRNNISNLMRRVIITYAMYVKRKYDHSGTLFEGKFKSILIDSDYQLLQLSKYIHRNPIEIQGSEPLVEYPHSSYPYFTGIKKHPSWLDPEEILTFFSRTNKNLSYGRFVEESPVDIEKIKPLVLE